MINEKIYTRKLRYQNNSVFEKRDEIVEIGDDCGLWDIPLVIEFLKDDDIQEISIISSCIGFIKTLTKQYKKST